jgi:predicted transcriptional regulator
MTETSKNSNPNNAIELIRVLNNSIHSLGLKRVISYLKWITKWSGNDTKDVADLIVYSVTSKYKVSFSSLLESTRNDGDENDAMCLLAILLKKHALMSQSEIAKKLNRHKSQVSKYISRMSNLNTELFKLDRKIYSDYIEINEAIEKLIQNEQHELWNKNAEEGDLQSQPSNNQ